jgi:cell wall assembly regulator SMI1
MSNRSRLIGTTDAHISAAEAELGFEFPPSFREWLKRNNGRSIEDVQIFPVHDERDPRTTWDSIVRNYNSNWKSWLENFESIGVYARLLPFGEFGTGDYFCFDFALTSSANEAIVVFWSHETGKPDRVANDFAEFVDLVESGELEY